MIEKINGREIHKVTEEKPGWCKVPHQPSCAEFVEIMASVLSREAWRCVWHMIQLILLESVLLSDFVTSKTTKEIISMGGGKTRRKGEAQKAGRNGRLEHKEIDKDEFIIRKPSKIHSRSHARKMKEARIKGRYSDYGIDKVGVVLPLPKLHQLFKRRMDVERRLTQPKLHQGP